MDKLNELAREFKAHMYKEGTHRLSDEVLPYLRRAWQMSREDILALAYDHYWSSLIKEKDLILCHLRSIMGMATTQDFATEKAQTAAELAKMINVNQQVVDAYIEDKLHYLYRQLAAKDKEIAELKAERGRLRRWRSRVYKKLSSYTQSLGLRLDIANIDWKEEVDD